MRKIIIAICLLFWPLSLFLNNPFSVFVLYLAPLLLLCFSFLLRKRQSRFFLLPCLIIPLVSPKLALFPVLFSFFFLLFGKERKYSFLFFLLSLIIFVFSFKGFFGQTVFVPDYEAQQKVIRDTHLYSSVFLARMFHNKARIVLDKFNFNFFALIDPNNYFFGFHPRQIIGNQNLVKFPFLSVILALFGFHHLKESNHFKFILLSLLAGVLSLSVLTIFDGQDFILWLPLSLVLIQGIKMFERVLEKQGKWFKGKTKYFYLIFLFFSLIELIRIFIK